MDHWQFRNIIASLFNLDLDVLIKGGVIDGDNASPDWFAMRAEPAAWVLRLPDSRLEALWKLVEARQKPPAAELEHQGYVVSIAALVNLARATGLPTVGPIRGSLDGYPNVSAFIERATDCISSMVEAAKAQNAQAGEGRPPSDTTPRAIVSTKAMHDLATAAGLEPIVWSHDCGGIDFSHYVSHIASVIQPKSAAAQPDASEDRLADLRRLLESLGLGTFARAASPKEVFDSALDYIKNTRDPTPKLREVLRLLSLIGNVSFNMKQSGGRPGFDPKEQFARVEAWIEEIRKLLK